ncbi:MAG: HAD family hydrolase [Lachnospiraceae bacterium]
MIKNIVFDMGNVLVSYDARWVAEQFPAPPDVEREVLSSVFFSQEWLKLDIGLISEEEGLEGMKSHLDTLEKQKLAEKYFENWHIYNMKKIPGMAELVQDLKAAGKQVYVLSNASIRLCRIYKETIPAWEYFDGMLFSAEVGYIKPQKEIYLNAFERFGISANESFFVDDLAENIEGGKKLGMDGYVFDGNVQGLREIFFKSNILK